ncbi:DUF2185 domain-containing protein [Pokkaliibacter sp. MBI-7]|uniref:immunity protein Imm33 domain-containing protein n=1 Tax=Pokkaliibacter sp. MBI-7 TaxID=3040600 RepID=UPI00244A12FB|nr:DUF2185 domain-containing protein [Pokkaliibacter sp. MBI-7]MDH2434685.1 DUF2185 domain-containing protein [Pokkaliibacter sp. MBI-7]
MQNKTWHLVNAQAVADEFPYTFYKPSPEAITLLKAGNLAKLIFEETNSSTDKSYAERMWVKIENISNGLFSGFLDNVPIHIKDLKLGDKIEFSACHIINTDIDDPVPSVVDKYTLHCIVTDNILSEGRQVGYLYREATDGSDDSGWRFTAGDETEDYMRNPDNGHYVSIGTVLNKDDSILPLLEREAGVTFERDKKGQFVEIKER